ncbi:unnamed protein product [Ambrosiozyma monospora]|uniref:Unnamed protein product n=1 Tax=Ambrosiozyma monospora TaxID=43982 RepID=A0ACB5UA93_AMBMO|nr:unnamed protein product [Ambrosiozyma monospora]
MFFMQSPSICSNDSGTYHQNKATSGPSPSAKSPLSPPANNGSGRSGNDTEAPSESSTTPYPTTPTTPSAATVTVTITETVPNSYEQPIWPTTACDNHVLIPV